MSGSASDALDGSSPPAGRSRGDEEERDEAEMAADACGGEQQDPEVAGASTSTSKSLQERAEGGDVAAAYRWGRHLQRTGAFASGSSWVRKAAEQGHVEAQNAVAYAYRKGHGVEQSDASALEWYKRAAEQGHVSAMYNAGFLLASGRLGEGDGGGGGGGGNDTGEAARWYLKAAERGNVSAAINLGALHARGAAGVARSGAEAVRWWKKAATEGRSGTAACNLGNLMAEGDRRLGIRPEIDAGRHWWEVAAELGSVAARGSLGRLGVCLSRAEGSGRALSEAERHLEASSRAGHVPSLAPLGALRAMQGLNLLLGDPLGGPERAASLERGLDALRRGALARDAEAAFLLFVLLLKVPEEEVNPTRVTEALAALKVAQAQGHPLASLQLGLLALDPEGDRRALEKRGARAEVTGAPGAEERSRARPLFARALRDALAQVKQCEAWFRLEPGCVGLRGVSTPCTLALQNLVLSRLCAAVASSYLALCAVDAASPVGRRGNVARLAKKAGRFVRELREVSAYGPLVRVAVGGLLGLGDLERDGGRKCGAPECGRRALDLVGCAGCRARYYCGPQCQRADWGRHSGQCDALKLQRDRRRGLAPYAAATAHAHARAAASMS